MAQSCQSPDKLAVVIDNGSGVIKMGMAGEYSPSSLLTATSPDQHPVERGIVTNWEVLEKLWREALESKLKVDPKEQPMLVTETPTNPQPNKEKTTEIVFEAFGAPSYYLALQPVLSLYAAGRLNGVVLESGHGVTHALPAIDGNPVSSAALRLDLAGSDLTNYLSQLLGCKDLPACCDIKEKLCSVALDFDKEVQEAKPTEYKLPDGTDISVKGEKLSCPEALFQPDLLKCSALGIHKMTNEAALKCPVEKHSALYSNIVLAGGSMRFPGVGERMKKEVSALVDPSMKVDVFVAPTCKDSAWIGGSILAVHKDFQSMWITKQQYEESGPAVVKKCI